MRGQKESQTMLTCARLYQLVLLWLSIHSALSTAVLKSLGREKQYSLDELMNGFSEWRAGGGGSSGGGSSNSQGLRAQSGQLLPAVV